MKEYLLGFTLLIACSSCSAIEELEQARVPIDQAAAIADGIGDALRAADQNGDGAVQGAGEWIELAKELFALVRDLEPPQ